MTYEIFYDVTRFTHYDIHLFLEGTHVRLYEKFGAHLMQREGVDGVYFAVWAPNAKQVSIRADFNRYDPACHPMKMRLDGSGIWEAFIANVPYGDTYKYHIVSNFHEIVHDKTDPFSFFSERPSASASRVWDIAGYDWKDAAWMQKRATTNPHERPVSIYEVHLGSWQRNALEDNRYLTYTEMAQVLVPYVKRMNFTHVEFMPFTEYPFFGSWGYQVVGYFAPTARFGQPHELMALIDALHQAGIGVIMDWVPSHFAIDMHGLVNFDGTSLFEHADPRQGFHPEWGSVVFNYGRNEVRAFLMSSALFWLEHYHIDGIRVDAVASMLHLDYARKEGEWIPNEHGGNINLEAVHFLQELNRQAYGAQKGIIMIAEESTAYPMVTRPTDVGGLGFGFKWSMGWMHDSLKYLSIDPLYRQHHHHQITFSMWYHYDENFMLPLSHDEVVHVKGSLINKMPGSYEEKFANLRILFAYMMAHPGKKLLFMGGEFAQFAEWNFAQSLDWHLLEYPMHQKIQTMIADLNALYQKHEALYLLDEEREGFEWIDEKDHQANVLCFMRKSYNPKEDLLVVCNFANIERSCYRAGVSYAGVWEEIFNSQSHYYGGNNVGNTGPIATQAIPIGARKYALEMTLPPLGVLYFKHVTPPLLIS